MTTIGSNIASSDGVDSNEGPSAPLKVSLTLTKHLQNFKSTIHKWTNSEEFLGATNFTSIVKVVEALRMDPCGDIGHLLSLIRGPLREMLKGTTPLHWAVMMDDRVMVRFILSSKKVDINVSITEWETTALSYAIVGGNYKIVEDLLEYNADVFTGSGFRFMVREKDSLLGNLKMILSDNVNVCDESKKTALHYATEYGYIDVVAYLLNEKADANLKDCIGYTPLHFAAEEGHLEVVKFLLQQNVDVNAINRFGERPIHLAARNGATNIVSLLDNPERSELLHSLTRGMVDLSNALIEHGANVHFKDEEDNNALHLAIQAHGSEHNMMDVVKLLQQHNVDANAKNSKGYSPFFAAVVEGHTEVVKELLQSKEKIKLMEECNGQTVIQIAFDNGHEHIKRVLLECDDVS